MAADPPATNPHTRDDIVLGIAIVICLALPVVMTSLWAFADRYYPPMLMAVLLGIAIAALTYRYLGGTLGSEFSVGVLKVAGSAALLLGTAYIANEGLSKQMIRESPPNQLASLEAERSLHEKVIADQKDTIEELTRKLEKLEKSNAEILSGEIKKLTPDSLLGKELADMARRRVGPFSEVARVLSLKVTVVGYIAGSRRFNACESLGLATDVVRLTRVDENDEQFARTVVGTQFGVIEAAVCSNPSRKFDLQIGCADGEVLFPDFIVGCKDRQVLWKERNVGKSFEIAVEVLAAQQS